MHPRNRGFTNPDDRLLYNNVGATSEAQLDRLEVDLSIKRLMLFRAQVGPATPLPPIEPPTRLAYPIPPTPLLFNEHYLRAVHRYLFQNVSRGPAKPVRTGRFKATSRLRMCRLTI